MVTNEDTIRKRLNFFKDKNIAVHITKVDGWWHNGLIQKIKSDFIIIDDEREGDTPIFFQEIDNVSKRKPKEVKE